MFIAQEDDDNTKVSNGQGFLKVFEVSRIKLLNTQGLRSVRSQGIWSQKDNARVEGISEDDETKEKRVKL